MAEFQVVKVDRFDTPQEKHEVVAEMIMVPNISDVLDVFGAENGISFRWAKTRFGTEFFGVVDEDNMIDYFGPRYYAKTKKSNLRTRRV